MTCAHDWRPAGLIKLTAGAPALHKFRCIRCGALEDRERVVTPNALERLLRLAENLTPSGVIGDGMVAEFHSLAQQVRAQQEKRR